MVAAVAPGSIAQDIGLEPGDVVLAVDGRPPRDVIDFRFMTAGGEFEMLVERDGEQSLYELALDPGEPLGIDFESPVFDDMRRCRNDCPFCFVRQMPPGLRPSLYVRDDDYRYSFLHGSFITLTNLSRADWRRLRQQRLSPLYVSVHATEQDVRQAVLGAREQPPIMRKLEWLRDAGIGFHAQLVLSPGVNDGPHLGRSIADLATLGRALLSISVVPVGLTKYGMGVDSVDGVDGAAPVSVVGAAPVAARRLCPYDGAGAAAVLRQVQRWRRVLKAERGSATVYAADEWFLLAGRAVPSAQYYEGFPQLENGVGLLRRFLDCWRRARRRLSERGLPAAAAAPALVVCGTLMAPVWQQVAAEMKALGAPVRVLPVANRALGETVTVSGLLFAADVIAAVGPVEPGTVVWLPRSMLNAEGTLTLDGLSPADVAAALGAPVRFGADAAEVLLG